MTTRAILIILIVGALTYATRTFVPKDVLVTGSGAALAFGLLLIVAVQSAHIFEALRLPHLTAYLLCGLAFGPEGMGFVSTLMLEDLALVKGTAVGLIAFLAGCELNVRKLRPKLRAIAVTSALSIFFAVLLLFALFYAITFVLPITAGFTTAQRLAVALVCANVLAAFSPAVVIGIISETKASGPLSEMAMSIVIVADLVIVVTYALSSSVAHAIFPSPAGGGGVGTLVPHIFGSIVAGVIAGAILAGYVSRIGRRSGLVTFAVLFIAAEAGAALHLNPLLVGLAAGLFVENVTPVGGERLAHAAAPVAMPTFAIFFAVIGAEVHLHAFLHVAPFALAAAAVRALGIWSGARTAAWSVGMDRELARRLPFGLFPQAGVAIALAALVLNDFQPWGSVLGTVLLGSIVVNELVGPVLFRIAIVRAGEATVEREPSHDHGTPNPPSP
ncbi:MAG TPA: cation:proton antiporter [Thermoanaerobaculia bacterium]